MKALLQSKIPVRVRNVVDGKAVDSVEERTIREVIVSPDGVHADDVLNATRLFCAQVILRLESEEET